MSKKAPLSARLLNELHGLKPNKSPADDIGGGLVEWRYQHRNKVYAVTYPADLYAVKAEVTCEVCGKTSTATVPSMWEDRICSYACALTALTQARELLAHHNIPTSDVLRPTVHTKTRVIE